MPVSAAAASEASDTPFSKKIKSRPLQEDRYSEQRFQVRLIINPAEK
jgi:hypothetical protein